MGVGSSNETNVPVVGKRTCAQVLSGPVCPTLTKRMSGFSLTTGCVMSRLRHGRIAATGLHLTGLVAGTQA